MNYYSKSSISIVPSRWLEPFGRTSMESAAYGCATITTKNGGLPETFKNDLFLNKINTNELFKLIKKLIINNKLRFKIQKRNFSNVIHTIYTKVKIIDDLKNYYLITKANLNNGAKIKILHISTFDERNNHRLFNISIAHKLSKGFIRNGHDVINFSYRNYLDKNLLIDKNETVNKKTLSICNNYRPDLVVFGHNNFLYRDNIEKIKTEF